MVNFFSTMHVSQFLLQFYSLVIIVNDDYNARNARLPQRKVNEMRKFHNILKYKKNRQLSERNKQNHEKKVRYCHFFFITRAFQIRQ